MGVLEHAVEVSVEEKRHAVAQVIDIDHKRPSFVESSGIISRRSGSRQSAGLSRVHPTLVGRGLSWMPQAISSLSGRVGAKHSPFSLRMRIRFPQRMLRPYAFP